MEEKKIVGDKNTFWSFFGFWNNCHTFLRRNTHTKDIAASLGFTLIELLVVIAVFGVLAGGIVTVINPLGQIAKANDAKRKSDLRLIQKALELYYNDHNSYPPGLGANWYSSEPGNGPLTDYILEIPGNEGTWIPGLVPTYIKSLPRDPVGGQGDGNLLPQCPLYKRSYMYRSDDDGGQGYTLWAMCSMIPGSWDSSDAFYDPNRANHVWRICAGAKGCGSLL